MQQPQAAHRESERAVEHQAVGVALLFNHRRMTHIHRCRGLRGGAVIRQRPQVGEDDLLGLEARHHKRLVGVCGRQDGVIVHRVVERHKVKAKPVYVEMFYGNTVVEEAEGVYGA